MLILRPQPGADATAKRAREMGLGPVVAPLFTLRAIEWAVPDAADYDAVMLTSANALRLGGAGLRMLTGMRCYCVGEATAAAAQAAGFGHLVAGAGDAAALLRRCAEDGVRRILHLCGREHAAVEHAGVEVDRRIVYAADAVEALPETAVAALDAGAVALLHSPRAGALLARLAGRREGIAVAAMSQSAADAAGAGWAAKEAATAPTDQALLEVAAKLCKTPRK